MYNKENIVKAIDIAWKEMSQRTFDNTIKGKNSSFEVSEQDWQNSSFTIEEFKVKVLEAIKETSECCAAKIVPSGIPFDGTNEEFTKMCGKCGDSVQDTKEDWDKFREKCLKDGELEIGRNCYITTDYFMGTLLPNFISSVETQAIERTKREVVDILESFMKKKGGVPVQVADILTSVQTYLLTNKQ